MEHCFRAALCVIFLIGYLQAKPVCYQQGDMDFCHLKRDVKCGNEKFTYPENVDEEKCHDEVLQHYKGQLEHAAGKCQDVGKWINHNLEALEDLEDNNFLSMQTNSTECTLGTKESQFKDFVGHLKRFVELLNSKDAKRPN